MIKLPDVEGKKLDDVSEELIELGFIVLQDAVYDNIESEGTVMSYVGHNAGDLVEADSEITLKVSKGVEPTEAEDE